MKAGFCVVVASAIVALWLAPVLAAPTGVQYQGRLLNATGNPINSTVSVSVAVYTNETAGAFVYSESIGNVVVSDGLYAFTFGMAAGFDAALAHPQCWLQLTVNGAALTPRQRLLSVPYARRAALAEGVADGAVRNAQIATDAAIAGTKLAAATTTAPGAVQLAADGEVAAGKAVQANDSRLTGGGGGASGWTDDGSVVRLTTATDGVGIGTSGPLSGALHVQTSGNNGVYGRAQNFGVLGQADEDYGVSGTANWIGVYGRAQESYGVLGSAWHSYGVHGEAQFYGISGRASRNYGVRGEAMIDHGVQGRASRDFGVSGLAEGRYGVYGNAALQYGGFFTAPSTGLFAEARSPGGVAIQTSGKIQQNGVNVALEGHGHTVGSAEITDGAIVDADINPGAAIAGSKLAAATTTDPGAVQLAADGEVAAGKAVQANDSRLTVANGWTDDGAVVRLATATDGVGIGTSGPLQGTLHVKSSGDRFAVFGQAAQNCGVYGNALLHYGVYGEADQSGVFGYANVYGINGYASQNYGVYGRAGLNFGVYGRASNIGLYGHADQYHGVYGYAEQGFGVFGRTSSNCGVYGSASQNYGVYGDAAGHFGGFFTAENIGLYAEARSPGGVAIQTSGLIQQNGVNVALEGHNHAIGSAEITDGAIVNADINASAAIAGTKVAAATASARGTVELANDGEVAANVAVQGNDSRLSNARPPTGAAGGDLTGTYPNPTLVPGVIVDADINASAAIAGTKIAAATTTARGSVELATDGENAANVAVQGNDSRLSNARPPTGAAGGDLTGTYPNPTLVPGVIVDSDINASAAIAGTKIAAATTSARGTVELALDGETAAGLAVQGNDSRIQGWTDDGATVRLTTSSDSVAIGTTGPLTGKLHVEKTGSFAVYGSSSQNNGVYGNAERYGVYGKASEYGVHGNAFFYGVYGNAADYGVYGNAQRYGVYGNAYSEGVYGNANIWGVYGNAVFGGVHGEASQYGVYGNAGLYGVAGYAGSYGVVGHATQANGVTGYAQNFGVYGNAAQNYGGYFNSGDKARTLGVEGNIRLVGSTSYGLIKSDGSLKAFTIDHPLDPEGAILRHFSTEGPEALVIYSGTAVLDASGEAVVDLPEYFSSLARNPRVQLTPVGDHRVFVADEVDGNAFAIGGDPGTKVYWQVTAERNDAKAQRERFERPVEQLKGTPGAPVAGEYVSPECFQ